MEKLDLDKAIKEAMASYEGVVKSNFDFSCGFCRGFSFGLDRGIAIAKEARNEAEEFWSKNKDE